MRSRSSRSCNRLARAIEAERVEDAAAMRSALKARSWDVILSDWSLPTFSATAALGVLKESGLDIPFVIVREPSGRRQPLRRCGRLPPISCSRTSLRV